MTTSITTTDLNSNQPAPADLLSTGLRVIRDGQAPSGAYIASPNFREYHFGWLRDGSYVALAMDAAGDRASAEAFHRWAHGVISAQAQRIDELIDRLLRGEVPSGHEMLPTRYTLDGEYEPVDGDAWPNFQLDGYGTWLFALHRHVEGALPADLRPGVELAARYLTASWHLPCYDYWEEFGERRHTSTLAAIAAGLRAAGALLGDPAHGATANAIVAFMRDECVSDGSFVKGPEDDRVDASLVSIATPFGLVDADDDLMSRTIERIHDELASSTGGIRRYLGDTYYGGNPWLLLTAWLGWHDRLTGNVAGYERARAWIADHASTGGALAEQILDEPQDASFVSPWVERWGPVADPLLWSHAKYILMESGIEATEW